uniref:Uncharacterized protein n=1 Tax=Knipowitschia caucasica TaxID=637954 RepID=A0AAV2MGB3_KNICA
MSVTENNTVFKKKMPLMHSVNARPHQVFCAAAPVPGGLAREPPVAGAKALAGVIAACVTRGREGDDGVCPQCSLQASV